MATTRETAQPRGEAASGGTGVPGWFFDTLIALAAFVLAAALYFGSLDGEFVYDDHLQIEKNNLIQDPHMALRALRSDVWAFKGEAGRAWSNYWRPTFVGALIAEHRLFGIGRTEPWHAVNIFLHALASALVVPLVRRLGFSRAAAALAALVFASHPSRVENVAWVSGLPDLLLTPAMFGALIIVRSIADRATPLKWAAALALYALAQGAKEVAIFFPVFVVLVFMCSTSGGGGWRDALVRRRAIKAAIPFALIGAVYLVIRWRIVGSAALNVVGGPSFAQAVLTSPAVLAFYLNQTIWPAVLGPNYPLGVWTLSNLSLGAVLASAALIAPFAALSWWLCRRDPRAVFALGVFLLPLVPAMNISAFIPGQFVHDRYLYVSLLGVVLLIALGLEQVMSRSARGWTIAAGVLTLTATGLGAWRTVGYVPAWSSDLALWTRGVEVDPGGAFVNAQLGVYLAQAGKHTEAVAAFDKAVASGDYNAAAQARLGRAESFLALQRPGDAEKDLLAIMDFDNPQMRYRAVERLAVAYMDQQRAGDAEALLRKARAELAMYYCKITEKLAVILYTGGRKDQALRELEEARPRAAGELGAPGKLVLYRLGMLYAEFGRPQDAAQALRDYLSQTAAIADPDVVPYRRDAEARLKALGG